MSIKTPKILSVNTSDTSGGAARAAYRILKGVQSLGVKAQMFVKTKHSEDNTVISLDRFVPKNIFYRIFRWCRTKVKNKIQHYQWSRYPNREKIFMSDLRSTALHGALQKLDYDVLHLHWVNLRFLDLKELRKVKKPIVWTLHDSWTFCGICHYFYECENYKISCGRCPFLHSEKQQDLSCQVWKKKQKAYQGLDLHIVTPSQWLADCAKESALLQQFPVTVIPNCLDIDVYKPLDKEETLRKLNLFANKKRILYGAVNALTDSNKGFRQLIEALKYLEKNIDVSEYELLVFGADKSLEEMQTSISIKYLGYLGEEAIVTAYNIADAMVVPSLSEVFGQTASEALACGTPVVAFNCSGIKEVVNHKINGYLAEAFDTEDFGKGILWCLENNEDKSLSLNARQKVEENYTIEKVCREYLNFYKSVMQ